MSRRAPSRRFLLAVVAVGIVIALLIMGVRDADAESSDGGRAVGDEAGVAFTLAAEKA